jgi:ribosomal protein S9
VGENGSIIVNEHPSQLVPQPSVVVLVQTVLVPGRNTGEVGIQRVVTHGTSAAQGVAVGPSVTEALATEESGLGLSLTAVRGPLSGSKTGSLNVD